MSAMLLATSLGLVACSDKTPGIASGVTTQPAADAPATSAPVVPAVTSELTDWTGDLAAAPKSELCNVDAVNGASATSGTFEARANQPVSLEGWIATTDLQRPDRFAIVLQGDASAQISGGTGKPRADVAQAYHSEQLANAGYTVELATLGVAPGSYTLALVHDEKGQTIACMPKLTLVVK
jgi:hypothetical protein